MGLVNHFRSPFCQTEVSNFVFRIPCEGGGVAARSGCPANDATEIIDDHIVVFSSCVGVSHDALEDGDSLDGFDLETGFFEHLALERIFQVLTGFEYAARDGPIAFERLTTALNEKDLFVFVDE